MAATKKSSNQTKSKPASKTPSARPKTSPQAGSHKAHKSAGASPSRGGRQPHGKPTPKTAIPKKKSPAAPVRAGLSIDQKLDILGIVMALLGLLTLLSMLSPLQGSLTGAWVDAIGLAFGWGRFVFPLILLAGGLWFILRSFERIPQLAVERLVGFILLFFNLLALVHFTAMLIRDAPAMELAAQQQGGGYAGGLTAGALVAFLGPGGAAIALGAWLLISLALLLDITIAELLHVFTSAIENVQDWWSDLRQERRLKQTGSAISTSEFSTNISASSSPISTAAAGSATPSFLSQPLQSGQAEAALQWTLPPLQEILDAGSETVQSDESDRQRAYVIQETLASFGAPGRVVEINRGPAITQFGVEPDFIESRGGRMRVRVGKIASLADDLALALSARTIRVQAPVPGKGFVGIEVPNEEITLVALRDLIESEAFKRLKSPLRFALGLNVSGNAVAADLSSMPHLLIAGATGSGKSVCVNALICCLLLHNTPNDLRIVMVDPKRVELTGYNGIPHLLAPVVVELERVVTVLQWVTREMDMRYRKLAEAGCRNIQEYNARMVAQREKKMPFLVVIIDELADLMMLSPDETERTITRLAQLARATGIHLVIATQRPSVDVVTGLIKANFPARIAFAVASGVDSRVILDQPGAERLLGRGDMLFQAPDAPAPVRLQGVFVSEVETLKLVTYWQSFAGLIQPAPSTAGGAPDAPLAGLPLKQIPLWEEMEQDNADPMLKEAVDLSRRQGRASISMLQRRLRIGYTRAARLIETMEEQSIIGPPDPGTGTREILDYGPTAPPADEN
ncbi:MAG: hypothetical protein B6D39_07460 [Anaerolineae bacterium UTCFX2]|mgnify:CR=1 FL=1|jgi:S-DNA-T family DNA segregation ATPase FtsK/SpoIIIE|nr:DNA translocase FtsK 4TM domain-containing protein [Anaerolineae bacterium]MCZ7552001.1 DNA translocase FtsK [Anaerolineales bacterium]OQY90986.1 MAG: hypothetical protein B6D39_07460 [Anaerolineae bacterium UTCFX2]